MKIEFEPKSNYVEIIKDKDKIIIVLSSQDSKNARKTIVNSVELSNEQWIKLISDIS